MLPPPTPPPVQGAMYVMFGLRPGAFPAFPSDVEFCQALLAEENVVLLPGACFNMAHFVRVVFCAPLDVLATAFDRVQAFCARHLAPGFESAAA